MSYQQFNYRTLEWNPIDDEEVDAFTHIVSTFSTDDEDEYEPSEEVRKLQEYLETKFY